MQVTGVADVVVDGVPARIASLSYLVPDTVTVTAGDAVEVPFGKSRRYGLVVGHGNPELATREIAAVFGRRVDPIDLAAARRLADMHFSTVTALAGRFAPADHKGAEPIDAGPLELAACPELEVSGAEALGRCIVVSPTITFAAAAARRAAALAGDTGQVLVLCPSVALVEAVLAEFGSGAARLDAAAAPGAWAGFVAGSVRVGVATAAGAWYSAAELAGIVVADATNPGHVSKSQPYLHSRDIAVARTAGRRIPVELLVDAADAASLAVGKLWTAGPTASAPVVYASTPGKPVPAAAVSECSKVTRAGGKVLVVVPEPPPARRCVKCRQICACSEQLCDHPQCLSCGERMATVGWDAGRVSKTFGSKVAWCRPSGLSRLRSRYDLVVVLAADSVLRAASLTPEYTFWRHVAYARGCVSASKLVLVVADPNHQAVAALATGRPRDMARVVWASARDAGLPPFGCLLTISSVARPNVARLQFPGSVFGPRRLPDGSWETIVSFRAVGLGNAAAAVERLRAALRKVRVTLAAAPPPS